MESADVAEGVIESLPTADLLRTNATITPRQEFVIAADVDTRYSDDEAANTMVGQAKRLYVFGEIHYKDIYEKAQVTKFCHMYVFTKDERGYRVWPLLHEAHNRRSTFSQRRC